MKRLLLAFSFLIAVTSSALAQAVYQAHTHLQLISEQDALVPGKIFWVGLHITPDQGWHLYWTNPGDSGFAPQIKWDLPSGLKAGETQWPYPERIDVAPLTSFGYEHEILLLVPISVDSNFKSSGHVDLRAQVGWLTCAEMCVPGKANVELPMAVSNTDTGFNNSKSFFDQARMALPQSMPDITSQVIIDGDHWRLNIQSPSKPRGNVLFYPYSDTVIEHNVPQNTDLNGNNYEVLLTKSHLFQGSLKSLDGIAVNPAGWDEAGKIKAITIHATVAMAPPVQLSFWIACIFAFVGGLILNLMPCVFPVLSIKVLHLVERHTDKAIALRHSLMYALGVLASVWALALILFILKAAGQFAGWGFQFQSPIFVVVVAVILFILALNLFGVFEFSAPAISGLSGQKGLQGSFISGVVTTIVASPCTAPFMGTALTAAISQPNIVGFGIFTCLGLGLASPFVLLSVFPSLLAFVPKPGPWMVNLKRVLGAILLACVIWLVWVFSIEAGIINNLSKVPNTSNQIQWQAYSPEAVDNAHQQGKGVFIDFTAAWCINCQVNDRLVLENPQIVDDFKQKGIIAFKADWTKYDPVITKALSLYGRDSIPVYVYYAPGSDTPVILPQVITPKIVLEKIK